MLNDQYQSFFNTQLENEKRLEEFVETLQAFCCCYCYRRLGHQAPVHHHGGFFQLAQSRIPLQHWIYEKEHGFLHGFLVAFLTWFFDGQNYLSNILSESGMATEKEKTLFGALIHDIISDRKNHDAQLREYFPDLLEIVYSHSNPIDENHPLILADRLELMRFHDHPEWIQSEKLEKSIHFYGQKEVNHFYTHIRPVLQKMFLFRDDVWLSHGMEGEYEINGNMGDINLINNHGVNYFPKQHWIAVDPGFQKTFNSEKYIAINIGNLPCTHCLNHRNSNQCPKGIISLTQYLRTGNEIGSAPESTRGRDHPFMIVENPVLLSEWIILYDDIQELTKMDLQNLHTMNIRLFNKIYQVSQNLLNALKVTVGLQI